MRLLVLLTSAVAVAGLLAACGGGGEPEEKADLQQGAKTEERGQPEGTTSPKAKIKDEAKTPTQEPRKEKTASVSEQKGKLRSQDSKNYGSREELAERFGLPSNEEEAYHRSADRTVRQYGYDIKQTQRGIIELQQAFETRRIPTDKPWATPAILERDTLNDIEKLMDTPGLFENWDGQVPTLYEECHLLLLQTYDKGLEAAEAFVDYMDDYERATLEKGLDLSKDVEALAHDAESCLGDR